MEFDKKKLSQMMLLITFAIFLFAALENMDKVLGAARWFLGMCSPFLLGACIAFVINVPMRFIENKLLKKCANSGLKRIFALVLSWVGILGVLTFAIGIIAPQMGSSLDSLALAFRQFGSNIQQWATEKSVQYPTISEFIVSMNVDWATLDWQKLLQAAMSFLNGTGNLLGSTFSIASSVVGAFVNFFIGLFFSVYILLQKEVLGRQIKKLLYATFSQEGVARFLSISRLTQQTFANFITGQCTEAVVLGLMFFITMTIFRFPYAILVGVLIAITALIPIFGAFIGCALGAFFILMVDPIRAAWFIVLFLVLQQIEGNFIYPHVVGNSVGLPAIWVLVAVTIGGSMLGVIGMLVCIPLFSVFYALLRSMTNDRLKKRGIRPSDWEKKDRNLRTNKKS